MLSHTLTQIHTWACMHILQRYHQLFPGGVGSPECAILLTLPFMFVHFAGFHTCVVTLNNMIAAVFLMAHAVFINVAHKIFHKFMVAHKYFILWWLVR